VRGKRRMKTTCAEDMVSNESPVIYSDDCICVFTHLHVYAS
jgi:hypothetical protein